MQIGKRVEFASFIGLIKLIRTFLHLVVVASVATLALAVAALTVLRYPVRYGKSQLIKLSTPRVHQDRVPECDQCGELKTERYPPR